MLHGRKIKNCLRPGCLEQQKVRARRVVQQQEQQKFQRAEGDEEEAAKIRCSEIRSLTGAQNHLRAPYRLSGALVHTRLM